MERLIAEVTERCVRRGRHTSVRQLEDAMLALLGTPQPVTILMCNGCFGESTVAIQKTIRIVDLNDAGAAWREE